MPYEGQPVSNTSDLPYKAPYQDWSDSMSRAICKRDFNAAETYRAQNHDWRFRNADQLYLAWVNQLYWEGTRIPRSSLPVYLVFQQVEALIPKLVSGLFSEGDKWCEATPGPTTTIDQARNVRELLFYFLNLNHEKPHQQIREVYRKLIKEGLIYGNGVCEIGYEHKTVKRRRVLREFTAKHVPLPLSKLGIGIQEIQVPTGEYDSRFIDKLVSEEIERPFVKHQQLTDFYMDPNNGTSCVQSAQFCCSRSFMSVSKLSSLRNEDGFTIPSDSELIELSRSKPT